MNYMTADPLEKAIESIAGFKRKADHNKNESLRCFILIVTASLSSPLFVTLGEGIILGKIVPSVLSLMAAGGTAWLQLRKPQNLWSLYRDCERRLEDQVYRFQYHLHEYAASDQERRSLLADALRRVAWDAHQRWLPLVPTPEALGTVSDTGSFEKNENDTQART